jgi:hypothetical protein
MSRRLLLRRLVSPGRKVWRIWCLAIGEKAGRHNREADAIALIRTLILLSYISTNACIVAGVLRHWNN